MIVRRSARELIQDVESLVPRFQERLSDAEPLFPLTEFADLAACGALSAALPVSEGGLGLGVAPPQSQPLLRLLYEVGHANQVIGRILEGHINALLLIARYGTPEQVHRTAEDVLLHNRIFGVWNTGPAGQPSVERQVNGTLAFSGGKTFASGAGHIHRAIVTGLLDGRDWQMFLLPLDEIAYQIDPESWHPMGMEASDSFTVDFSGVVLDPDAILGQPDDYYAEPAFTGGAFRFAAIQLGAAEGLAQFCRNYLRELRYENDPHQLYRMGQMTVLVESGRQWVAQAARWMETEAGCDVCLTTRARMLRVAASDICRQVMDLVETSIGARGLQGRRPFSRMLRDLRMYLRQAGPDSAITAIGRASFEHEL